MDEQNNHEECECGMPLNEKTRCDCAPGKCVHCCGCPPDCDCGCREKEKILEKEEAKPE